MLKSAIMDRNVEKQEMERGREKNPWLKKKELKRGKESYRKS